MTTTTNTGVDFDDSASHDFDAAEGFMSKWNVDPETASEPPKDDDEVTPEHEEEQEDTEAVEETEETDESEDDPQEDSEEEAETDDEGGKPSKTLDDDATVKVKVDEEEFEVSVKDLKRLYGQEAALTRKSQALATQRKDIEANGVKLAAQLERIHQKALARWEPYSKVDMLLASKQLDAEQFAALRQEAQAAYDDYRFITQEVDGFVQEQNTNRQKVMQQQAKEAVKVLQDAIPNWSQKLYDEIREYAIGKGLDASVVNNMVDPTALLMLHKARLFDNAKSVVTTKKVTQAKKVLKTTQAVKAPQPGQDKLAKQKARLAKSGSTDDAADLFLARWDA